MVKFKHDCTQCKFLGHYFEHDVYVCQCEATTYPGSLVARHGDNRPDYGSCPINIMLDQLQNRQHKIQCLNGAVEVYQDYIFSDSVCKYTSAIVLALAIHGLKLTMKGADNPSAIEND